jgi:hypothetical protein
MSSLFVTFFQSWCALFTEAGVSKKYCLVLLYFLICPTGRLGCLIRDLQNLLWSAAGRVMWNARIRPVVALR